MIFALYKKVMRKKRNTLSAFRKAIKVINSCENEIHLQGAQKYINNFLVANSKQTQEAINGVAILKVDPFIESAYARLSSQLKRRKEEIS